MQIIWQGQSCFQIIVQRNKQEQVKVVIDPYDNTTGLRVPSTLEADVALITHDHADHNNTKALKGTPFLVTGPGEYEVKEVFVRGIPSFHDATEGKERGTNTMYTIEAEGVHIAHLGDIGQKELTSEQVEAIGNVDILFIPVGGVYTVAGKEAAHIISQIEPKIVIPMHYLIPNLKIKLEKVDEFLKAMGAKASEPQNKLTIKAKDLEGEVEETKVVVLTP